MGVERFAHGVTRNAMSKNTVAAIAVLLSMLVTGCDRGRYTVRNVDAVEVRDVRVLVAGGPPSSTSMLASGAVRDGRLPHRETALLRVRWRSVYGTDHAVRCEIYLVDDTEVVVELRSDDATLRTASSAAQNCAADAVR